MVIYPRYIIYVSLPEANHGLVLMNIYTYIYIIYNVYIMARSSKFTRETNVSIEKRLTEFTSSINGPLSVAML